MPKISKSLTQAYQIQDFAFECIKSMRESLTVEGKLKVTREDSQAIAMLGKVWKEAQERISFHRRVPSPGSLRPERSAAAVRRAGANDRLVPMLESAGQSAERAPSPGPSSPVPHTISHDEYAKRIPEPDEKVSSTEKPDDLPR